MAVTNDSTYGYDAQRHTRSDGGTTTTVHLSLIRAPRYPDRSADQGEHTLRVAVRPGATIGDAVEEGYRTNLPTRVVRGDHGFTPLVEIHNPSVVVEAVKRAAHDRSGDVIVRLYESRGARAKATVRLTDGATAVVATDLLERTGTSGVRECGELADGVAQLRLRPFQLVTLRFSRSGTTVSRRCDRTTSLARVVRPACSSNQCRKLHPERGNAEGQAGSTSGRPKVANREVSK